MIVPHFGGYPLFYFKSKRKKKKISVFSDSLKNTKINKGSGMGGGGRWLEHRCRGWQGYSYNVIIQCYIISYYDVFYMYTCLYRHFS